MLLLRSGGKGGWTKVPEAEYEQEADLEKLLHASPELFPVADLGDEVPELRLAVSQIGLPGSGTTDLVAFDEDGTITVIECKLARNPESKRKVVGQILEYGAWLWGLTYEQLERRALAHLDGCSVCSAKTQSEEPGEASAATSLAQWVGRGIPDFDPQAFQSAVSSNLAAGDFRLVIAVDHLGDELGKTIDYINRRSDAGSPVQLLALELRYCCADGGDGPAHEILVPRLVGSSFRTQARGGTGLPAIEPEQFFATVRAGFGEEAESAARKLAALANEVSSARWRTGSFSCRLRHAGREHTVFFADTAGRLWVTLPALVKGVPSQAVDAFVAAVRRIPSLKEAKADPKHNTICPLGAVFPEEKDFEAFASAVRQLKARLEEP